MHLFAPINTSKQATTLMKGLAIVGVVVIHLLTLFPERVYAADSTSFLFFCFNQALRFCVPIFVFVSGFGLSLKFQEKEFRPKRFFLNRMTRLLPLYLLWTLYLSLLSLVPGSNYDSLSSNSVWRIVFLGQADYHLYFVPMIFKMYFLFALFRSVFKNINGRILLVALGLQLLVYSYFSLSPQLPSDQAQYLFVFSWIGYFALGIWAADNKKLLTPLVSKVLLVLGLVSSVAYSYFTARRTHNVLQANRFTKVFTTIYATGLISWLMTRDWSAAFIPNSPYCKIFHQLGKHSFLIYLAHTVPLHFLESKISVSWSLLLVASYALLLMFSAQVSQNRKKFLPVRLN